MNRFKTKPNVFVVNTPYQLLNAIEAVHSFQLTNNHLVVIKPKFSGQDRFAPLIKASDWATVSFPLPFIDSKPWVNKFFGSAANRWYCRYLHFRQMRTLARMARRFRNVDHLFLGHYFAEEKPFMRHLANTIKYNTLCLLDDGTDTIEIGKRRQAIESTGCDIPAKQNNPRNSSIKAIKAHLRAKYWEWHLAEIPSVTFFTIYEIDVRSNDRLIRNNYSYLRSLGSRQLARMPDTVIFLGQCIADGYFEMDSHFEFLTKVREYFGESKIIYVAHPRESPSCIKRVNEQLQWDIWPSSSVIEQDLVIRGIRPKAIAGIVSSALITLAYLMDSDVEIVCFHIAPEHWIGWREEATGVYRYLKTKARGRVTVVPASGQESEALLPSH